MLQKRDILIASLGNILEWFDFGLFIFFAPLLGEKFFPNHDPNVTTLAVFSVFATGYLCRPIGGIIFGYFGDTAGRTYTLRFSILFMTLSTLAIGMLPSYATIGFLAPVLFTLLRMIQGISIGGEYSGILIYLAESAPLQKRGFITSFAGSGSSLGILLVILTTLALRNTLSVPILNAWGWRIPFIFIGSLGTIIFYYRFQLKETPVFQQLEKQNQITKIPLWAALKSSPQSFLRILGLTCLSASFYSIIVVFVPTYLSKNTSVSFDSVLIAECLCMTITFFCIPLAGKLGDYYGRKNMLTLNVLIIFIFILFGFSLLQQNNLSSIFIYLSCAAILTSIDQGNNLAAFVENCPPEVRYTVISFSYNVGNALFGATGPLLATILVQHFNVIGLTRYLLIVSVITFLTVLTLRNKRETLDRKSY